MRLIEIEKHYSKLSEIQMQDSTLGTIFQKRNLTVRLKSK